MSSDKTLITIFRHRFYNNFSKHSLYVLLNHYCRKSLLNKLDYFFKWKERAIHQAEVGVLFNSPQQVIQREFSYINNLIKVISNFYIFLPKDKFKYMLNVLKEELTRHQRKIILKLICGKSIEVISQELGRHKTCVYSAIHGGMKRLKKRESEISCLLNLILFLYPFTKKYLK